MPATISERALAARQPQGQKRFPDFTVRARTGPGQKDWMRVGSAWRREKDDGGEVITVVLGALPLSVNNKVTLKLLKPIETADETEEAPQDV